MASRDALGAAALAMLALAADPARAADDVVFAQTEPATLCIEVIGQLYNGTEEVAGRGSGFFLNDLRSALTDNHVLPDLNLYQKVRINGRVRTAVDKPDLVVSLTIKARDVARDLALLEADAPVPSRFVLRGDSRKIRPGMQLIVLGCPLSFGPTMTGGRVSNVRDDPLGRWLVDAPINPGNSGGPVLTSTGELVGVAWGGIRKTADGTVITGLNYVIPIHQAMEGVIREQSIKTYDGPSVLAAADTGGAGGTAVLSRSAPDLARARATGSAVASVDSSARMRSREGVVALNSASEVRPASERREISALERPSPAVIAAPSFPTTLAPAGAVKRISRAFEISRLKDDHPSITPTTEKYTLKFAADAGYKFTEFEFGELSRNHGSAPVIEVSPDGKEISVQFSLTSGPLFDRYRGWLDGTLVTRQARD